MQIIKNVVKKIFKDETKVLGRWNIDYCATSIKTKVDLANEDHCGPCGEYILDVKKIKNNSLMVEPIVKDKFKVLTIKN